MSKKSKGLWEEIKNAPEGWKSVVSQAGDLWMTSKDGEIFVPQEMRRYIAEIRGQAAGDQRECEPQSDTAPRSSEDSSK